MIRMAVQLLVLWKQMAIVTLVLNPINAIFAATGSENLLKLVMTRFKEMEKDVALIANRLSQLGYVLVGRQHQKIPVRQYVETAF